MKHIRTLILLALISSGVLLLSSFENGDKSKNFPSRDNTPGTVTFTAKTLPAGGNYAPRHVLAIWVEHGGEFVKTRKAMANQRKQYLYTWRAASNYNVVDAITGPTLTSHQTHTVEWDCTDLSGNVVTDGQYVMWIEFTDKHAQGPVYSIEFTKGTEPVTINPPDQTYIINMALTYEPEQIAIADFTADQTEVCAMETVVFTDISTGATEWEWDFGTGATPPTANLQGPHNVYYTSDGSKTVELIINGSVTQTKTDYITVYANPVADFTFEGASFVVDFTNISTGASSYLWDFGDGETSTEENPTHVYGADGTYEVTLTATSDMCGDDVHTETVVIYTVGVPENQYAPYSIFPNPTSGKFFITSVQDFRNVDIKIFDVQGRIILNTNMDLTKKGDNTVADINTLTPGLYFILITNEGLHFKEKLLVK
nr:DUF2271 domain-containing protein [Bacteroidota bacterium]